MEPLYNLFLFSLPLLLVFAFHFLLFIFFPPGGNFLHSSHRAISHPSILSERDDRYSELAVPRRWSKLKLKKLVGNVFIINEFDGFTRIEPHFLCLCKEIVGIENCCAYKMYTTQQIYPEKQRKKPPI